MTESRVAEALAVPLAAALGLTLLDPDAPEAGVRLTVDGLAGNGAGGLHASALSAAIELAGYLVVVPTLGDDEHAVTHASAVSLIAGAATGDDVDVRAELDRRGRHVVFVTVSATCGDTVVARAQLTKSIVRRT